MNRYTINFIGSLVFASLLGMGTNLQAVDIFNSTQKVIPAGLGQTDLYGWDVATDGPVAVMGAPGNPDGSGRPIGEVRVYRMGVSGWEEKPTISAPSPLTEHHFGFSVEVQGDLMAIAAQISEDSESSGVVYIYKRTNGIWVQKKRLSGWNWSGSDLLRKPMDLHSTRLAVGANLDDVPALGKTNSGAVYLYTEATNWALETKIAPSTLVTEDNFGWSVSLYDNSLAVGAPGRDDKGSVSGSVYVYRNNTGTWQPDGTDGKIVASEGTKGDRFGESVAIYNNLLLVGAMGDNPKGSNSGSVYSYEYTNLNWTNQKKVFPSDSQTGDVFGRRLDLFGQIALIGASQNGAKGSFSGVAYVLSNSPGDWNLEQTIRPTDINANDFFGASVEMSDEHIIIGAPQKEGVGAIASGAAYILNSVLDSLPIVTVTATDATASETGVNTGTFQITRTGSTTNSLTVKFTVGGTATSGADFTPLGDSVVFPAGAVSVTKLVSPIDDAEQEPSESVLLTLQPDAAYSVGNPNAATVTISDNDKPTVSVSIQDSTLSEPGTDTGIIRFTRTGATTNPLTINFRVDGTAIEGVDFLNLGTAIVIPVGAAFVDKTVTPLDDQIPEANETVQVSIVPSANYALGSPSLVLLTIIENDNPVLSVGTIDFSASEQGPNNGTYRIIRTGPTTESLSFNFTLTGSATEGSDYARIGTSKTIQVGASHVDIVVVPIDDNQVEGNEEVILTLLANVNYDLGSPPNGTIIITDNDKPVVTVLASDPSASEPGTNTGQFRISRTGPTDSSLNVTFVVGGSATQGTDFISLGTSRVIPAGSSSVEVIVTPKDDTDVEGSETVLLSLISDTLYTVGSPSSAQIFISDDDKPVVTLSLIDGAASEPGSNIGLIRVNRNSTVNFLNVTLSISGSATAGTDYETIEPSRIFIPGSAANDIFILPLDDIAIEGDETVRIQLVAGDNYTVGSPNEATVTISDNDKPVVSVTATDANASETGPDKGTFRLSRAGGSDKTLTVSFTLGGSATEGSDYTPVTKSHTFAIGSVSFDVNINPIDDNNSEGLEIVTLNLTPSANYTLGIPSSDSLQITDNDASTKPEVTVIASDNFASEAGLTTGKFKVSRTGDTAGSLTIPFLISGNAQEGSDYQTLSRSVVIPSGASFAEITLTPIDDNEVEGSEFVRLTLQSSIDFVVGSPNFAEISIGDDDKPVVSIIEIDTFLSESGLNTGRVRLIRTGPTASSLNVTFNLTGSARSGSDYQPLGASLAIPAGSNFADIIIIPIDDTESEGTESVIITLASNANYTIGSPNSSTLNIEDDDKPIVTVEATDSIASEPGTDTGVFRLMRSGSLANPLTVQYITNGTATPGSDFNSIGTSRIIPAGSSRVDITLSVIDDDLKEEIENVQLFLVPHPDYVLAPPSAATIQIHDDDKPVLTVTALDATATEKGEEKGQFQITRTGPTTDPLTVLFTVRGSATEGVDYQTINRALAIPVGSSNVSLDVLPIDDSEPEVAETVILALQISSLYSVADPGEATVNLIDDDANQAPEAHNQDLNVGKNGTLTITLTASDTDGDPLTYNLTQFPSNGMLEGTGANRTYKPAPDFVGKDKFTFTANDGKLDSSEATISITISDEDIVPNQKPKANAGPNQPLIIDLDRNGSELVWLDASASLDPDGTIENYQWKENGTVLSEGTEARVSVTLTLGQHDLLLTVTDNVGATDSDTVVIIVTAEANEAGLELPKTPNIFNPAKGEVLTIPFKVESAGNVEISFFDRFGNRVKDINAGFKERGVYEATWKGDNGSETVASGLYHCLIKTPDGLEKRKFIVSK